MLAAAVQSLALLLKYGPPGLTHLSQDERAVLEKDLGKAPAGWDELAFQEAASIIRLAQHFLNDLGAPSIEAARQAAEAECAYTAELAASFPAEVWITVKREPTAEGVREHYSVFKRLMIGAHKL